MKCTANGEGAQNEDGVGENQNIQPIPRDISETLQDKDLVQWKANWNMYELYRMVLFSMTLGDP